MKSVNNNNIKTKQKQKQKQKQKTNTKQAKQEQCKTELKTNNKKIKKKIITMFNLHKQTKLPKTTCFAYILKQTNLPYPQKS